MAGRPRDRDPLVLRLLDEVIALEREPWPSSRPAYATALLMLAIRCEQPGAIAEMYRWAQRTYGGLLQHPRPRIAEFRRDALTDIIATLPGTLLRFRAGLDDSTPPHLISMLRAAIRWRANDLSESLHRRHARREAPARDGDQSFVEPTQLAIAEARQVWASLDPRQPTGHALRLIGAGLTVAEAARRTGCSRQQIYRARDALRARHGPEWGR